MSKNLPVDRNNCPYTIEYLSDDAAVKRSILGNPFEKFERKRFMFHAKADKEDIKLHPELKDLNNISFSHIVWEEIVKNKKEDFIKNKMLNDLKNYYESLGGLNEFTFGPSYEDQETHSLAADSPDYTVPSSNKES